LLLEIPSVKKVTALAPLLRKKSTTRMMANWSSISKCWPKGFVIKYIDKDFFDSELGVF
jgi:hypothetical protein